MSEKCQAVDHPKHYGGDTIYEAIKVIDAWELGFCLGNTIKYISRCGKKDPSRELEDLEKAMWYLDHEIKRRKAQQLELESTVIKDNLTKSQWADAIYASGIGIDMPIVDDLWSPSA